MSIAEVAPGDTAAVQHARRSGWGREVVVTLVLLFGILATVALGLSFGDFRIPLADVIATLSGRGDTANHFIIIELRLPRVVTGLCVGLALGLAGAIFQALLRNPLASPDMIGVTQGAGVGAVVASISFGLSGFALSASALGGAVVTSSLIYALAWQRGVAGYRLILVGIGVAFGLASLISYVMTSADVTQAQEALVWLTGSLNGSSLEAFWPLLICLVVLVPLTVLAALPLPALQLGDDTAAGLGVPVERSRRLLLACAVGLTGVAVAAAGPVSFVAFVAGPVARRLLPAKGAALLQASLVGALIVLVADFVAQHLLWAQMPVGVVTSLIGAPFLLYLLARANRIGKGG
ncbi:iron chelate uptake ABC transporter family permease subunit [Kineosporia sp. J2-2]|uniref:Iron chelate uptake ABC transporter family permease subunit n=1 Tax=Kineosporia corallincola TaxID=2835133 RepID=A0ABS5TEP9_9ACTN|nr:iron chelate uptake ABC transporter family permease subunit [Kineosporia corallincola]MBT0769563.1 iron chelate uptake ABC transporter family permease subunit [Kineosporia corallincola]